MTPIFHRISLRLQEILKSNVKDGPKDLDILEWMTRVALELVGQGGLGYSFGTLDDGAPVNEYAVAAKNMGSAFISLGTIRLFVPWFTKMGSPGFLGNLVRYIPWNKLRNMLHVVDVMDQTSKDIFEKKKVALQEGDEATLRQIGEGRDIMSILLRANMTASEEDRLSDSELLGQMSTLIFAAMDTTSSALSRILFLLAEHQDVQDKLRIELTKAREAASDPDYDTLHALPYLEAVCRETLRLYPPISFLSRTARDDVVLPLGSSITGEDGTKISNIPISKNTNVIISIVGVNRDPTIWGPDASEWKPERWLSPLPASVSEARVPGVYSNMLTFLGGGRACIGFKFSQLEMKVLLSVLIPEFGFSPSKEEIIWRMGGVSAPTIKGFSKPMLPLKLSSVNEGQEG